VTIKHLTLQNIVFSFHLNQVGSGEPYLLSLRVLMIYQRQDFIKVMVDPPNQANLCEHLTLKFNRNDHLIQLSNLDLVANFLY